MLNQNTYTTAERYFMNWYTEMQFRAQVNITFMCVAIVSRTRASTCKYEFTVFKLCYKTTNLFSSVQTLLWLKIIQNLYWKFF